MIDLRIINDFCISVIVNWKVTPTFGDFREYWSRPCHASYPFLTRCAIASLGLLDTCRRTTLHQPHQWFVAVNRISMSVLMTAGKKAAQAKAAKDSKKKKNTPAKPPAASRFDRPSFAISLWNIQYTLSWNIPWVKKKQDTKLLAITSLIIIRFSKKISLANSVVNLQQIHV